MDALLRRRGGVCVGNRRRASVALGKTTQLALANAKLTSFGIAIKIAVIVPVPHVSEEAGLRLHLTVAQATCLSGFVGRITLVGQKGCKLGGASRL